MHARAWFHERLTNAFKRRTRSSPNPTSLSHPTTPFFLTCKVRPFPNSITLSHSNSITHHSHSLPFTLSRTLNRELGRGALVPRISLHKLGGFGRSYSSRGWYVYLSHYSCPKLSHFGFLLMLHRRYSCFGVFLHFFGQNSWEK